MYPDSQSLDPSFASVSLCFLAGLVEGPREEFKDELRQWSQCGGWITVLAWSGLGPALPEDGTATIIVPVPCPGSALCASGRISVWQTLVCWVRRHLLRHSFSKHKFPVYG